jgi:hypothetical protein
VNVIVNLPAVRPGRLAATLKDDTLEQTVRELRLWLRGAGREPITDGMRLRLQLDVRDIAALADQVRALADAWPFLTFRLLADPPECWLEVTGPGRAGAIARAVFGEVGR